MDSLIFMITLIFLVAGIGYGRGAGTIKSSVDVITAVTKTFASLAGLVFMLLVISQFIAYFNYSNMPQVIAGGLAHVLEQANVNEVILLIGLILVVALLDIIMPGARCRNGPSSRRSSCRSSCGWASLRRRCWPPTALAIRR